MVEIQSSLVIVVVLLQVDAIPKIPTKNAIFFDRLMHSLHLSLSPELGFLFKLELLVNLGASRRFLWMKHE
jgi:hypothetical protein